MRAPTPALAVRQARQHVLEHGSAPQGWEDALLVRSWQRSAQAGLQPSGALWTLTQHDSTTLRQSLARNHALVAHARPVMEFLLEQVRHTASVVVLADREGMLVHTLGDAPFLERAERVALACGASWAEAHRGTNAIGTALAEGLPVVVHGAEHYLERNAFLTCAAAPIWGATGELLGTVDISGDQRGGHPHTLGLVSAAARMIENRLLRAQFARTPLLSLHAQPEGVGSVGEALLAVAEHGTLVGANRAALGLLGLRQQDLGRLDLSQVFDLGPQPWLAAQAQRVQPLRRHGAGVVFGRWEGLDAPALRLPAATTPAPVAAPAARATGAAIPPDALARLDTGDAQWREAAAKARKVLDKGIALLIQGESGVGKELFARAFHDSSARRQGPFVAINCAALPEHLIEAELFGYVGGAFTGARREGNPGRLREAHGGTLFLDEIGDMPLALQTRLLRVLQERTVTPIGASQAVPVDFALVCATHQRLREAVAQGRFRSDLYYRINALGVHLPALRERSDFLALTERLLREFRPGDTPSIAPELLQSLSHHPWPGNLRQYANVLRTACALCDEGAGVIGWQHLGDDVREELAQAPAAPTPAAHPQVQGQTLQALSQSAIQAALQATHGNVSQAARLLGISRQTLYRKLGG
ncbi:MAG: sigma-54-dependent Fis family transcriptional regulator [Rhodoferax sp.]